MAALLLARAPGNAAERRAGASGPTTFAGGCILPGRAAFCVRDREVILEEAGDIGADLVLKGAFTRSRFQQIVFGGTTQHILDYARVPVLLAH